jgi:hypothetical protein
MKGMETVSTEEALDQASNGLDGAVTRQRHDRDPAHEDFYIWGGALSDLTARMQDAGRVLGQQVEGYGQRRILRDDEGGDPMARLAEAGGFLQDMVMALDRANVAARAYHSAIGHIAVEVDPEAQP